MQAVADEPTPGVIAASLQALRTNPLILSVLLLNALFVVAGAWYLIHAESGHAEHLKLILDRCLPKGTP